MTYEKEFALIWIALLPLIGAAVNLLFGRKLSRRAVHLLACGTVAAACGWALYGVFYHLLPLWLEAHEAHAEAVPRLTHLVFEWISAGTVKINLGLVLDPLSAVMAITVTFVGFLIHVYSTGYMAHEKDYARFFGYLNLFTGAMLLLVLGDSLVVLFVGWEGVGVCSYLLIGFWYNKDGTETPGDANARAGKKAFIVNRIGDFAFVLGMFILFYFTRTLKISELAERTAELTQTFDAFGLVTVSVAGAAAVLLFIGATGKSAQIPLYIWLPDAMAGPTPVSALIHAATMVTAGVYMVARLNFVYMLSPTAMGIVALVGAVTAVFAATIGFAQNDIKKVLAYSTVSQLGYMFVGVGVGAFAAGVFHLFTHAFFKACLFLCAGSVIHALGGEQDIRKMGGLARRIPWTHLTFLVSTIAIAGIFPFAGFFSKDEILWQAISRANPAWPGWFSIVIYVLCIAGALFTAFYMFRLYFLTFQGECRADAHTQAHVHESPWTMTGPLAVLAFGALVLGVLGLPGWLMHHGNVFHLWLEPVMAQGQAAAAAAGLQTISETPMSHNAAVEVCLAAASLCVALAGIFAARGLYRQGFSLAVVGLSRKISALHRLVSAKYMIDELYHLLFVAPLTWIARILADAVDAILIDFVAVNGTAKVVDVIGQAARLVQSGNLQRYVVVLLGGVAIIVYTMAGPEAQFVITPGQHVKSGQPVVFEAELKSSGSRQVEYRWDFDGDGKWDTEWRQSPTATHTYSKKERVKVGLKIRDLKWQREETDHQLVEVQ